MSLEPLDRLSKCVCFYKKIDDILLFLAQLVFARVASIASLFTRGSQNLLHLSQ